MVYNKGTGEFRNWILEEDVFDLDAAGKCESIMCQGNGYLGLRAATEENYEKTARGLLVAGTFDKPDDDATELANAADVTAMDIKVNGEDLDLSKGEISDYSKNINFKTGLLERSFVWTASNGCKAEFIFKRVVSLKDFHIIASFAVIKPHTDVNITFTSGIDGENIPQDNHFSFVEKNSFGDTLQLATQTVESKILFLHNTFHMININGSNETNNLKLIETNGKQIKVSGEFNAIAGQTIEILKISNVFTNRDKELENCSLEKLKEVSEKHIKSLFNTSFEQIASESAAEWENRIWKEKDIIIDTSNEEDQLAIRFAIYHLTVMAPTHDNRMNIGAKGLSGPGYKGHSFWDTEIFMLPFFIFASPKEARSLLEHRYNSIEAARINAKNNGYEGAMYPWESAWITDGETTPSWAMTGLLEHHITADIAFGAYYYYTVSGDEDFMDSCGYELIIDTAKFWLSRLEYNKELDRYEINDVIGPDEYKEHVNNNAFTNYMSHLNISLAVKYADRLRTNKPELFEKLDKKLGISNVYDAWKEKSAKIYLPRENSDGLVPQDDTFLSLRDISREDCSLSEMMEEARQLAGQFGYFNVMISKQADIMVLFYLLEDLFSPEIKRKNFYFYEKRCFHDSSLSLSTYSVLASDLNEKEQAYKLFERATMIDLGNNVYSSDAGIHSASLGGIWQCTILGFAGIRMYGEQLRIQPNLPDNWKSINFNIYWKGQRLNIIVNQSSFTVNNLTGTAKVEFLSNGTAYKFNEKITVEY